MWTSSFVWKEMFGSDICPLSFQDIDYDLFPECSWGIAGYITNFTYKKVAEIDLKMGPSGTDGSDENNPLVAYVSARYKQIVETLTWTTNVEDSNPESVSVDAAFGGGSISLAGASLISVNEKASSQEFTAWTYTIERISSY
jgi:hypothetical protein